MHNALHNKTTRGLPLDDATVQGLSGSAPCATTANALSQLRLPALPRRDAAHWWLGGLAAGFLHGLLILAVASCGLLAIKPQAAPLRVVAELSLDGLAGPGGQGGDGRANGGAPALPAAVEAAQPPAETASEPAPQPQTPPVLAEKVPEPQPTPKPKPKPAPPKKIRHRTTAKRPAHSQPQKHVAAVPTTPSPVTSDQAPANGSGTGLGAGLGTGGNGPGKGQGQGAGPPGIGGGPGGGGGGDAIGQFGHGDGPRFRHRCLPRYPEEAKEDEKEGSVTLRLAIDADGILRNVKVLKHSGLEFAEEALRAVRNSTYYPARRQGHPIACLARLTVRFKLN